MTPADHNKAIGIMHLIYGGFFTLIAFVMLLIFGGVAGLMSAIAAEDPNAPPAAFFWVFAVVFFVIYLALSLPSLVAGYAMLKRKSWSRMAGIVASVLAAISFPFGTALCVYSLWFFFGEAGRAHENGLAGGDWRGSLGQGPAYGWEAQQQQRQGEREYSYRPPQQPPDWRE